MPGKLKQALFLTMEVCYPSFQIQTRFNEKHISVFSLNILIPNILKAIASDENMNVYLRVMVRELGDFSGK